MSTLNINSAQFETLIADHEIVFIDFWATWCAPCKQFAKIFAEVADLNKDIIFASVNIETESQLAEAFHIRSIPHLIVFKQGIAIYSEAGSMPTSTLKELVQQALVADVTEIKVQLKLQDEEAK